MGSRVLLGANGTLLFLLFLSVIVQPTMQTEEEDLNNLFPKIFTGDLDALGRFIVAQFFPATEWDPIPVFGWLQPPGTPSLKIFRCKRADVMNCTHGKHAALVLWSYGVSPLRHVAWLAFAVTMVFGR